MIFKLYISTTLLIRVKQAAGQSVINKTAELRSLPDIFAHLPGYHAIPFYTEIIERGPMTDRQRMLTLFIKSLFSF